MNNAQLDLLWKDYPSDKSPVDEVNLNRMVRSINLTDENVHNLDANKATKDEVAPLIADVQFDEKHGIFTFIRKDSVRYQARIWDTKLEQLVENLDFDEDTQKLIITKADGEQIYVDVSAFVKPNEFLNSDTVLFSIEGEGKVSAIVKEGSIEEKHLRPNYLAEIKIEVGKAKASQMAAEESATESESWAHGGTNTRPNEETDNAKAYAKKAEEYSNDWKGSLLPQGTISFSQLPTSGNKAGHMYNISQAFETDSRFEEGTGYSYPAGTNVYWNENSKWDCLSGTLTKVLTQAEYDSMTESEKNNGTIYYITDSDNELSNATDKIPGVVVVDSSLSETSKNPVQNKIITERLNLVSTDVVDAENRQKTYTDTKIADLINGAPSTLDTLGEISDAMAANQGVVEALNSAIGTKVDKVSGKGLSTNDYTTAEKNKLAGIAANANNYSLPAASASARGGVKTGYAQTGKNYPVQLSNEQMFVNVPWTDTQTITGVKGNAESSYRTGNVNITAANIGLGNVNNTADANKNVASAKLLSVQESNWKQATDLPSTYPQGITVFMSTNPSGELFNGIRHCTVHTIKSYTNMSCIQFVYPYNSHEDRFFFREAIYNTDAWRPWYEVITSKNIGSQSVNYATSATSATKAAQDSDGNVIKNTYAKYRKLTQEEYNALPSSKNSDNVLYFITD